MYYIYLNGEPIREIDSNDEDEVYQILQEEKAKTDRGIFLNFDKRVWAFHDMVPKELILDPLKKMPKEEEYYKNFKENYPEVFETFISLCEDFWGDDIDYFYIRNLYLGIAGVVLKNGDKHSYQDISSICSRIIREKYNFEVYESDDED